MSVRIKTIDLEAGDDLIITRAGNQEIAIAVQNRNGKLCVGGPINNRCKNFLITEKGWKKVERA